MIASGRLAKLEGELALQKNLTEEMKKNQLEMDEFMAELDEVSVRSILASAASMRCRTSRGCRAQSTTFSSSCGRRRTQSPG
jgi:hypothetical protein